MTSLDEKALKKLHGRRGSLVLLGHATLGPTLRTKLLKEEIIV
jgi:hypothetical protein